MIATTPSVSIAPAPMNLIDPSFGIMRGVVPEPISAWNPEIAPQAITMKQNGKTFIPGSTGPVPFTNGVTAGIRSGGGPKGTPGTKRTTRPNFFLGGRGGGGG